MSAESSYRKRSRDVRVAARSHLVALRAARRNRTGKIAVEDAGTVHRKIASAAGADDFQPDAEMLAAAEAVSFARSDERGPDAGRVAGEAEPGAIMKLQTDAAEPAEETVPAGSPGPADDPEPEPSAADEAATVRREPIGAEPEATAVTVTCRPEPEPGPEGREGPDHVSSDLFDLPGAGSGLVWMLRQCGIHALEDLAKADATQLGRSLGLVGELLDVAGWIAFARQRTAARGPDGGNA